MTNLEFGLVFLNYDDLQMSKLAGTPNYISPADIDLVPVHRFLSSILASLQNCMQPDDQVCIFRVNTNPELRKMHQNIILEL